MKAEETQDRRLALTLLAQVAQEAYLKATGHWGSFHSLEL